MNETGFIFSRNELMILMSILGGKKLYGFWHQKNYKSDEIIQTFNTLVYDGIVSLINKQIRLKPDIKTLLHQILNAKFIILVTFKENDNPQICYAVCEKKITGYHTISVQQDAVSLFSLSFEDWEKEMYYREIIPDKCLNRKDIYYNCFEKADWPDSFAEMLKDIPNAYCFIQYINVSENKTLFKIVLCKEFGEVFLLRNNGNDILKTNDLNYIFDMENLYDYG